MEPGTSRRHDRVRRVLILVENASVPSDRRVIEEARSLSSNGYVVSVIAPAARGEEHRESLEGIEVRRFRPIEAHGGAISQAIEYLNALAKTLWLMLALARNPGFDVIQACNPPDLFFLIVWPFRLAGKRFIFDQHDLSPELYASLYSRDRGFLMRVLRWAEHRSYRLADAVLVCNESYRHLALSRGGVDSDQVFIVRNGPRRGWPLPVRPDPSLKRGRRYLVAYMGIMGYQDGLDVLLEAVHFLVHTMMFREATFTLVGHGSAVPSLMEQARRLDIDDFVHFAGWIPDEETMSLYLVSADACVCPEPSSPLNDKSTFAKVMEYMAAQKPIIAFDLPETRFSAQGAAAYAAPGDIEGFASCIRDVLTDEVLSEKMTQAAAERIPSLRWEGQVPALLAAYDRALRANGEDWHMGPPANRYAIPSPHDVGGYTVRISSAPDDPAWDEFLEHTPTGHHAQTSAWGRARASIGWNPIRLVISEDGRIVGGAQMVRRPMPVGGYVGFVHRGPQVPPDRPDLVALVFSELIAMGKAQGVGYLVVQPPPGADWMTGELRQRGFRCGAFDIDMTATVRLDLRKDLEELLADMSKKRRKHVRSAAGSGITVRRCSEADLPIFNRLKDIQSARLGYARRSPDYYSALWRAMAPREHVELFIAEYEGDPVVAQLVIPFGEVCRHMERVWSGERKELRPSERLEWEVIKWARSQGYRYTDFEGIEPQLADAILSGVEMGDVPEYSASLFKLRFGGSIVVDPSSYDYVYNPLLRFAYRCVPVRVMRSDWMRRLLFRFRETGS